MATIDQIKGILTKYSAAPNEQRLGEIATEIAMIDCSCTGLPSPEFDEVCPLHGRYTFEDLRRMLMDIHAITVGQRPVAPLVEEIPTIAMLTELTNRAMAAEADAVYPDNPISSQPADHPDFS